MGKSVAADEGKFTSACYLLFRTMKSSRQKTTSSPHTSLSRTNIYSFFPLPPTVTAQSIPHWLGYNGRGTTKEDFPHSGVYYSFRKFRRRLPFFEDREKVWLTLFEFWQLHSSAVEEENGMGSCVMCICKSWQQSCDNVSPSPPKIGFLGLPWEQNYVFKRTADMRRFHTWNAHTVCICGHCWTERNEKPLMKGKLEQRSPEKKFHDTCFTLL